MRGYLASIVLIALGLVTSCDQRRIAENDAVYYSWDGRRVLCGAGIDEHSGNDLDNIDRALARAAERGELLTLYAHEPGDGPNADLSLAKLAAVLQSARDHGVRFTTFAELATAPLRGGPAVAITFDDSAVDAWHAIRDLLASYDARVTFFVTRVGTLSDARIDKLRDLASDGHAIESHGAHHLDAPSFAEEYGTATWVRDEFLAGIEELRIRGFTPTAFAYPFGARTTQLDDAALEHVVFVRSLSYFYPVPLLADPCPN